MATTSIKFFLQKVEQAKQYGGSLNELSLRNAFFTLLSEYAKARNLVLVAEISLVLPNGQRIIPDGTIKDVFRQDWGYWESKDEADNLDVEIEKKLAKGYPDFNILFEDSTKAVLIQEGREIGRVAYSDMEGLDRLLKAFVSYERPEISDFRKALKLFARDVPKVTQILKNLIDEQEVSNPNFQKARHTFFELCKVAINPGITLSDIREMMVQHILTADIFNTVFAEAHFHRENNIAKELESVLATFFTGQLRRDALSSIKSYYMAINAAAARIADHHEKQKFLKQLYQAFYNSYNPNAADRLGVVYTPGEIVRFMVEITDELLNQHFDRFLEDEGVEIIDPATGTGTFVCEIIDFFRSEKVEYKYRNEIHANEVAILPYYIANLNIEFTYKQKTGHYLEFENLCFVDTLDNMGFDYKEKQTDIFAISIENAQRIKKQNKRSISVIIGNPPYNANQVNENDNNKNRQYEVIDQRIKDSFIKFSTAQKTKVYDMYSRFYRWAFDRLNENGIIAFVTNRSFIDSRTFDGFRKIVQRDFDFAYIIDTKSDVRDNPKISGTGHNVFGIQTGVAIMILVRKQPRENVRCLIRYFAMDDFWSREEKLAWFSAHHKTKQIPFEYIRADKNNNWINLPKASDWESLVPILDKSIKEPLEKKSVFYNSSLGLVTSRDEWVYDLNKKDIINKIKFLISEFNSKKAENIFTEDLKIKWSRSLIKQKQKNNELQVNAKNIKIVNYRPFSKRFLYFSSSLVEMPSLQKRLFVKANIGFAIHNIGNSNPLSALALKGFFDLCYLKQGNGGSYGIPFQFPKDETMVSNITNWAIKRFRSHYPSDEVTELSIFHYVYAVLHNPVYRKKYELNLKRDYPRIPIYPNFSQWANWGKTLMDLHIEYESVAPFGLINTSVNLNLQPKPLLMVDKKAGIIYLDEACSLSGIPPEAWEYKLGNRSALEWVLEQYKEKVPKDVTIREQFNSYRFADYKSDVINLLDRVCNVAVQTVHIQRQMEENF